jgi:ComF family protein
MNLLSRVKDFFSLFYPGICHSCSGVLISDEWCICAHCWYGLPKTGFHLDKENALTKLFWGRTNIETGTALFYYQKGGRVQHLIHQLKYKNKQDIGRYLGLRLGQYLADAAAYQGIDCIVPVPLHAKRMRERGFNQSNVIGSGLSEAMRIPMDTASLVRLTQTQTQTRKRRFTRWENVASVFELSTSHQLSHKHILLVDDVITTGSTIEACTQKLLSVEGVKVWVATLGVTV